MREQWCCGGPGGRDGLRRPRAQARRAQRRRLARGRRASGSSRPTRTTTSPSPRTTRSYFGDDYEFEIVLGVELVNDLVKDGQDRADRARRAHGHLPRPVPAEQAQGRARRPRASCCARCPASRSTTSTASRSGPTAPAAAAGCRSRSPRSPRRSAAAASRRRRRWRSTRSISACPWSERPLSQAGADGEQPLERDGPVRARRAVGRHRGRAGSSRETVAFKSAVDDAVIEELRAIIGDADRVLAEQSARASTARACPAPFPVHRWADHMPDVAVLPKTAQEVSEVVKLANRLRIPVVPARRRHRARRRRRAAARRHPRRRQAHEPDPRDRPRGPHRDRRAGHQHAQAQRGAAPARRLLSRRPGVVPVLARRRAHRHRRLVAAGRALRPHARPRDLDGGRAADRRDRRDRRGRRAQAAQVLDRRSTSSSCSPATRARSGSRTEATLELVAAPRGRVRRVLRLRRLHEGVRRRPAC